MIFIQEIAFSNQESCRLHSFFNFTYKLLHFPNWFEFSLLTGAYSCLRVVLTFARQLSFFIVTIYIPCFMIVIVSWMSFWIDHKAVSWLHTKNVLLANSNAVVLELAADCPLVQRVDLLIHLVSLLFKGSCSCVLGRHHLACHVHHSSIHQQLLAARGIHKGHWRVEWCLCHFCLRSPARICTR